MAGDVDVWMAMHWRDYFADTGDLDAEESGAYLHILGHMWLQGGSLPLEPERLRRLAKVKAGRWSAVWRRIRHFFEERGDSISQKRLTAEIGKAAALKQARKQRTEAARAKRRSVTEPVTELATEPVTGDATSLVTGTPVPAPAPAPLLHELPTTEKETPLVLVQGHVPALAPGDAEILNTAADVIHASALQVPGLLPPDTPLEWQQRQPNERAHLHGHCIKLKITPAHLLAVVQWAVSDPFWRPKVADAVAFVRQWRSIVGAMQSRPTGGSARPGDAKRGVLYTGTDAEFEEMAAKYGRAT